MQDFLRAKSITAQRHEIADYSSHDLPPQPQPLHIWCVEGTAKLTIADAVYSLQPGDALDVSPQTPVTINTAFTTFAWYQE